MKTVLIAIIVAYLSYCIGYNERAPLIQAQSNAIIKLNDVVKEKQEKYDNLLNEYDDTHSKYRKAQGERNEAVLFAMNLCKKMEEKKQCLMELAIKTNSKVDFKD